MMSMQHSLMLIIWKSTNMKKAILVAVVYIIIFAMEILVYCISKEGAIYYFGLMTLIAFVITFGASLDEND